jgi:hypothetical protein
MAERRRPVLLECEMADPCEAVTAHRRQPQPTRVAREQRDGKHDQHERGADKMHAPARGIRMLGKVERIELAEIRVACHVSMLG